MRPVCVKCKVEMRVERNGIGVLEYTEKVERYNLHFGDGYKCPMCGIEVVLNFGNPIHCLGDNFESEIERCRVMGLLLECFVYIHGRRMDTPARLVETGD